jgi:hypothetical protein
MSLLRPGAAVFVIAVKKPDGTVTAARLYAEKGRYQAADVMVAPLPNLQTHCQ